MTLNALEFIRRFLMHVLPRGFVRIRHYGFLANPCCKQNLSLCRQLLSVARLLKDPFSISEAVEDPGPSYFLNKGTLFRLYLQGKPSGYVVVMILSGPTGSSGYLFEKRGTEIGLA